MDMIGAEEVRIYSTTNGRVARYVYTDKGYEDLMGCDDFYYSGSVTYQGNEGEQYYAVVTLYCGKNGGYDTRNHTTDTITA